MGDRCAPQEFARETDRTQAGHATKHSGRPSERPDGKRLFANHGKLEARGFCLGLCIGAADERRGARAA